MAELRREIWKSIPIVERITIADNYYEKFLKDKVAKWTLKLEDFEKRIYRNAENRPPDEVFEPIRKLSRR